MGCSASKAIRMTKRYGHIGQTSRSQAVEKLANETIFDAERAQKWAQWEQEATEEVPKCKKRMAPQVGLEPTTLRLTAGCSAIELLRSVCALPSALQIVLVL